MVKALAKAGIVFPISKKNLLDRIGSAQVQVDFDKKITVEEYCKNISVTDFENKSQFFNALIGSNFKF
jgi:hypothetical protein